MKRKLNSKLNDIENDVEENSAKKIRTSDEPASVKRKWNNRTRVLMMCSRGIEYRIRHLMKNMLRLLPHSKTDSKLNSKSGFHTINDIGEMKNCNNCIFFEGKKKRDFFMWVVNLKTGPSFQFQIENVHTMEELKLTGNCLKGSRPLLSFSPEFDDRVEFTILKELFTQIFSTPNYHPKSQPFIDHVYSFTILDGRVWFRNYQIVEEDGSLAEIGPRFVLNPIKILKNSFFGPVLYENPLYNNPNEKRSAAKRRKDEFYEKRRLNKKASKLKKETPGSMINFDSDVDQIFQENVDDMDFDLI